MTQPTLPMADPLINTTVEFHTRERRHYRRGEVKEAIAPGVYRIVEVTTSRRGEVHGRSYVVDESNIRRAS